MDFYVTIVSFGFLFLVQILSTEPLPFILNSQASKNNSQAKPPGDVYFPEVDYPVLVASNCNYGKISDSNVFKSRGPFRPTTETTKIDDEDTSYKDPKWWKMMSEKLKSSKNTSDDATSIMENQSKNRDVSANALETNDTVMTKKDLTQQTTMSNVVEVSEHANLLVIDTVSEILLTESSTTTIETLEAMTLALLPESPALPLASPDLPPMAPDVSPLTPDLPSVTPDLPPMESAPLENLLVVSKSSETIQDQSLVLLSTLPTIESIPLENLSPVTDGQQNPDDIVMISPAFLPAKAPASPSTDGAPLENIQSESVTSEPTLEPIQSFKTTTTLEDIEDNNKKLDLTEIDSIASTITNLILNPTNIQKRTPENDLKEKASFVWMAVPYVDENAAANVIPLVVLKFPPIPLNKTVEGTENDNGILVDSLNKDEVHAMIATKLTETLANTTLNGIKTPLTIEKISTINNNTEIENAIVVGIPNNDASLNTLKSQNENAGQLTNLEDLMSETNTNVISTSLISTNIEEEDIVSRDSGIVDKTIDITSIDTPSGVIPTAQGSADSAEHFKTIVIKIIRDSDNKESLQLATDDNVTYKTDNLIIQIIDNNKTENS